MKTRYSVIMCAFTLHPLTFDEPARYRISVQGKVPGSCFDCLEDMSISVTEPGAGGVVTTLVGELRDQASLTGVLTTLYELHLPVLCVECLSK
jgi:hypothetical protein